MSIKMRQIFPDELQKTATSLKIESKTVNRTKLLQTICYEFEKLYEVYMNDGFLPVKKRWESYSISAGKRITARTVNGDYTGIALGINEEGVLLLQEDSGAIKEIYSADIELD